MRVKEIATQFDQLPLASQRLVAELIEHLSRPPDAVSTWEEATAPGRPTEAIVLPPLDTEEMPGAWPENRFMNPHYYGAWADRDDIGDSTEFVRKLRYDQWGTT